MLTQPTRRSRIVGAIMGLASGDRNGGPMRMALRLAESLTEKNALDMNDVVKRYHAWFKGPPHDVETAFDSGPTWARVFGGYKEGEDISKLYEAAKRVKSWGVNSCHRALPLACCGFFNEQQLIEAVKTEGSLTHSDPVAVDSSVAFVLICRALIEGKTIEEGIENAKKHVNEWEVKRMLVTDMLFSSLFQSGKASETLYDSLYFVLHYFTDMVMSSIEFAGASNYCPVLVGAWAGAIYGIEGIPDWMINHHMVVGGNKANIRGELVPVDDRLYAVAEKLANTWPQ